MRAVGWAVGWAVALATATVLGACSAGSGFQAGVFHSEALRYRVGKLPPAWHRVSVPGGQVAFIEASTSATILANGVCGRDDAPLRVLTGHLLIGFTRRRYLSERSFQLAGREALRTVVEGKLDGVARRMELVVLKKDGCVFDLAYSASPERFAAKRADFERFLAGFQKLWRRGER